MSKLDDILNTGDVESINFETHQKVQIKALILELIGGDNYAPTGPQKEVEAINRRLESIRKKVEAL